MALQWWEYYEINHKVKNLQKEIEQLKEEIKALREQTQKPKRGRFFRLKPQSPK